MEAPRIGDYAIVGDGRSAALVARDGSVDWLCWPRFDSPSLFAAILDPAAGGRWRIAPRGPARSSRRYLEGSNVLVTELETPGGTLRLTDCMPVFEEPDKKRVLVPEHELLRVAQCTRGEVLVEHLFEPRPDYGRRVPRLRVAGGLGVRLEDGPELYTLRSDAPLALDSRDAVVGAFRMRAGERHAFSLTYESQGPAVLPPVGAASLEAIERTALFWQRWAGRCTYEGPYREAVVRSLLVLKLLGYAPSGAIVAAATTSLPERIGGPLNWDYRYCWLRDASMTVDALLALGYPDEATAFVSWLLHGTRLTRPRLSVLYDVYGRVPPREQVLGHLSGHRGSRPVRIANAAADQLQLDTYGEVIDALAQLCRRGATLDAETQRMILELGRYTCENWRRPDHGIWEPRREPRHHTHSRVLCWAALDRLLALHGAGLLRGLPTDRFATQRSAIRRDVEERSWNATLGAYTEVQGGDSVDASVLLLPYYGFLPASDPRMRSTFALLRERLEVAPGLLYRYEESRAAGEGAFGICSFWAVSHVALGGGTLGQAEAWFERLLPHGNDVGLFAEEIDPDTGEALGNVPQAFTHVGLVGAALAIERRRRIDLDRSVAERSVDLEVSA